MLAILPFLALLPAEREPDPLQAPLQAQVLALRRDVAALGRELADARAERVRIQRSLAGLMTAA